MEMTITESRPDPIENILDCMSEHSARRTHMNHKRIQR